MSSDNGYYRIRNDRIVWINPDPNITSFYILSTTITGFDCDFPNNITTIYINSNKNLTSLPKLPSSLKKLTCFKNKRLTVLPELPATLQQLNCCKNNLTVLPTLPPTLHSLFCDYNRLTVLPELPNTLTQLFCDNNCLQALPSLPLSLNTLYYAKNYITPDGLPTFHNKIRYYDYNGIDPLSEQYQIKWKHIDNTSIECYCKCDTIANVALHGCNHYYCEKCITMWFFNYNNKTCPYCRNEP